MPEIPAPSSSDRFSSGSASWKNMISLFIRLSKIDIHFFWLTHRVSGEGARVKRHKSAVKKP
jgi:hypothetical protein